MMAADSPANPGAGSRSSKMVDHETDQQAKPNGFPKAGRSQPRRGSLGTIRAVFNQHSDSRVT